MKRRTRKMSVFKGVGLGLAFPNSNSSCKFPSNPRIFLESVTSNREFQPISLRSRALLSKNGDDSKFDAKSASTPTTTDAKGSGTTARSRRLLKLREEKRKREHDRLHNYPAWAKSLSISLFFSSLYDCVLRSFHCC